MFHLVSCPSITLMKDPSSKLTLHMLTRGAMQGCGLTSRMVSINDKIHDIWERNVTIRNEI